MILGNQSPTLPADAHLFPERLEQEYISVKVTTSKIGRGLVLCFFHALEGTCNDLCILFSRSLVRPVLPWVLTWD